MKTRFSAASNPQEKIQILKLLPSSWSFAKIEDYFEANKYLIQESKKRAVSGITRIIGRPQISHFVKLKIENFYKQDDISSERAGRKECKSVKLPTGRELRQKRLLLHTLEEAHRKYLTTCQSEAEKVSMSTFASLRPAECVFATDSSAKEVCVCTLHSNMTLLVECLHKTQGFKDDCKTAKDLLKLLKTKAVCDEFSETCLLRTCEHCSTDTEMRDFIAEKCDELNITHLKFSMWVMSPRTQLVEFNEEIDLFLSRFTFQMNSFLVHELKVKKQYEYVTEKKQSLMPGIEIMAQVDFAEKFSCFVPGAPQSVYWDSALVTICPFDITIINQDTQEVEKEPYIFISNVTNQNTAAVYVFQQKLVERLKAKYPGFKKLIYLSDGCAGQFKNRYNFKNLCMHEKDFGIKAEWHFCATCHGKGPCDGHGGCIKRLAMTASIRNEFHIDCALKFYEWTQSAEGAHHFKNKNWNFIYVDKEECEAMEEKFKSWDRFENLRTVPGTHKFHQFIPQDEDHIICRDYSGQIKVEDKNDVFALHKAPKKSKRKAIESNEAIPPKKLRTRTQQSYAKQSGDSD